LNIAAGDRIVLYQGWISPERGIEVLVRAARHFSPGIRLVLIGYGEYERELRRISAEQGTEDGRVIFMGRVEPEDLPPLTGAADLGVIPYSGVDLNNYYCSPNKLFEYAAAGVPFLSNDLPFLRQMAEQYGFGVLADLTSERETARSIADIFADAERYARLKQAAKAAGSRLDWSIEGAKLLRIYREVLERTRDGGRAEWPRTSRLDHSRSRRPN
jgi:glycosyltransferase involved in cell wall biosynthesis